jgi:hypothetical protein
MASGEYQISYTDLVPLWSLENIKLSGMQIWSDEVSGHSMNN